MVHIAGLRPLRSQAFLVGSGPVSEALAQFPLHKLGLDAATSSG